MPAASGEKAPESRSGVGNFREDDVGTRSRGGEQPREGVLVETGGLRFQSSKYHCREETPPPVTASENKFRSVVRRAAAMRRAAETRRRGRVARGMVPFLMKPT